MSRISISILDVEQSLRNQLVLANQGQEPLIATKSQAWASNAAALLMALQQQQARCVDMLRKIDDQP